MGGSGWGFVGIGGGGRWIGGWEKWLVKECVGGSVGGVVGARGEVKRGIANVGCMMGVWRSKDDVNVLWKVCVCGSGVFAER